MASGRLAGAELSAAIVAETRSWIGTAFHHQATLKGVGCDCAGLLRGIAIGAGLVPAGILDDPEFKEHLAYTQQPNPTFMRAMLDKYMDAIAFKALAPGDVVWFRMEREPQHLAVITELDPIMMVHASNRPRAMKVVEEELSTFWRKRVQGCFRYRA